VGRKENKRWSLGVFSLGPLKSFLPKMERKLRERSSWIELPKIPMEFTSKSPMSWLLLFYLFIYFFTCRLPLFFFLFPLIFYFSITNVLDFFFFGCVAFFFFFFYFWGAHMSYVFSLILVFFFRKQFWVNFLCHLFFTLMKCPSIYIFLKV